MHEGNILSAGQYVSEEMTGRFSMRLEIHRGPRRRPHNPQDVSHVTHRDTVDDLVRIGREIERRVLARAVRWRLQDRVLVDGNRTVVFE